MARTDPQVNIRLPAELRDRLELARSESGRSLTAEMAYRIEASFRLEAQAQILHTRLESMWAQLSLAHDQLKAADPKFAARVKEMEDLSEKYWAKIRAEEEAGRAAYAESLKTIPVLEVDDEPAPRKPAKRSAGASAGKSKRRG